MALRLRLPRLTPRVKETLRIMGAGRVRRRCDADQPADLDRARLAAAERLGLLSLLRRPRLNQLPLGVVGIAIGTAILPPLSRQVRTGEPMPRSTTQNRGVELALLLTLPAAAALIVLAQPILSVLFERGAFGPAEAAATAAALAAYAAGLPALCWSRCWPPGFFAHRNTATPVKVAVVGDDRQSRR